MICYVDMEHERALLEPHEKVAHEAHCADIKRKLEDTSQVECVVRPYSRVTQGWLDALAVQAVVLSGNVTDWAEYSEAELRGVVGVVRQAALPVLGLCGGLQLLAIAHGAPMGPMRRLEADEEDPDDDYAPGYYKEWGFRPVRIVKPDPLFDGLAAPVFLEAHYFEVQELPRDFELLASTDVCRIQAMKQIGKPIYGAQFHPEAYIVSPLDRNGWLVNLVYPEGYTARQPDGRTLLRNFFRLAGVLG
ncbi:MAG: gamma-glutamyl-gamma-aminobutyrate hydrolase family protein [Anaerolineae bacterium]|jgi:GMP synthase-like glutamine amidotransferase